MEAVQIALVIGAITWFAHSYGLRLPKGWWRVWRIVRRDYLARIERYLQHRDNARRFALAYEPFRDVEPYELRQPHVNQLAEQRAFDLCIKYNLDWSDNWADINRQANAIREADMFLDFARRQVALRKKRRNRIEEND